MRTTRSARLLPLLMLLLLMLPAVVQAQFNYTTNNGTITITGYTGPGGAVVIPDTINGLPVTSIGDYAFFGKTNLTSVTIPNSVTGIGNYPFYNCTSLTSVTIPNSVTGIGIYAFYYCTSLTNVTIPNGVTSIGFEAFWRCTSLTSVTIPNTVTSIGFAAFGFCTNLASVIIPGSLTNIETGAFSFCTSLTSLTIPDSVTSIGAAAFYSCTSLSAITVDLLNSAYSSVDGVLFNKSQTLLMQCPGGKAGSYTIPNSVTWIGDSAFAHCTSLTSVTIPNSVTSIEAGAFWDCTSLAGVYFKGNAPTVGSGAFTGANNASVYYLPGTTGWGTTFAGRPAVLWNPLVETGDVSFGVRTNRFGFTITGASNPVLVVEAATNLANANWVPLQSLNLTNGAFYFSDPNWTNQPARFYRLRAP